VEGVVDELKTHVHQRRRAVRSKTADLVRQEVYGWGLTPAPPRLRMRWFEHVLSHAAALWGVSRRGLSNPWRVKRRNTP
jgi:hypothetical protein